jgi:hypothetical protein
MPGCASAGVFPADSILCGEGYVNEYYQKKQLLVEKISDTELMLFDEDNGGTCLLNGSAAAFYKLCGDADLAEVVDVYASLFSDSGVDDDELRADAREVHAKLLEKGVIWEETTNG